MTLSIGVVQLLSSQTENAQKLTLPRLCTSFFIIYPRETNYSLGLIKELWFILRTMFNSFYSNTLCKFPEVFQMYAISYEDVINGRDYI